MRDAPIGLRSLSCLRGLATVRGFPFGKGDTTRVTLGALASETAKARERMDGMRKAILLLVTMVAAVLVAGGVALAGVTKTCPTNCSGTQDPDTLNGSTNANVIKALGGGDRVHGWRGNDTLYGNPGNDAIYGDYGDDSVYGGDGDDYVEGGYGQDYIDTGEGSDKVGAQDGYKDRIVCGGGGNDVVYHDAKLDVLRGC